MNLYTYCRNNPIRFIDPSGHDALSAAEFVLYNPRPSSVNSAHDAKLIQEWDNEFKSILYSSVTINSAGDAALYQKATSTPSFKVNSASDARIIENQKKFYNAVKNCQYEYLTLSIMATNSVQPKLDPNVPPDHPYFETPKKGGNRKVKNPNGPGRGWESKDGGVWVPTPRMHGGEGWTVQYPKNKRRHWHAYPDGTTRERDFVTYDEKGLNFQYDYDLQFDFSSLFDDLMYDPYLPSDFGFEQNYGYNYGTPMIIPFGFEYGWALLW